MILYFSGTGNSEYVAKKIGEETKDEVVDLFQKIRNHDNSKIKSDRPWIIVAPTYAWRIPRILHGWLKKTELSGNKDIYFIMTCGGNIGNSDKYLKKLCDFKKMDYFGCFPIVMPENYIAMFSSPSEKEALQIIEQAEDDIDKVICMIKERKRFQQPSLTVKDRMNSSIVNYLFYPIFVHAKKFYAKDTCISCGKCTEVCALNNIHLEKGRPVWGNDCTHCMACICRCPSEAIEYGSHSRGMTRYICPK